MAKKLIDMNQKDFKKHYQSVLRRLMTEGARLQDLRAAKLRMQRRYSKAVDGIPFQREGVLESRSNKRSINLIEGKPGKRGIKLTKGRSQEQMKVARLKTYPKRNFSADMRPPWQSWSFYQNFVDKN